MRQQEVRQYRVTVRNYGKTVHFTVGATHFAKKYAKSAPDVARHTPIPWKWHEAEAMIEAEMPDLHNEYEHICDFRTHALTGDYNKADAAFIIQACNSHEQLLGAAKLALDYLWPQHNNGHTRAWTEGMIVALKIAIAKAEGQS